MSAPTISARESEVLALLGEHLGNAEIAARLFTSVREARAEAAKKAAEKPSGTNPARGE
ncbi:hypothetical protein [Streptomyces sp. NTH33]|uniref:hypothetical protein n=1 Tax=Streptomyces sp. NTH33 TaxID=1735453 RepID=UPI0015E8DDB1|nr:hypothetical protein [Streptomyces sp. NTH33]